MQNLGMDKSASLFNPLNLPDLNKKKDDHNIENEFEKTLALLDKVKIEKKSSSLKELDSKSLISSLANTLDPIDLNKDQQIEIIYGSDSSDEGFHDKEDDDNIVGRGHTENPKNCKVKYTPYPVPVNRIKETLTIQVNCPYPLTPPNSGSSTSTQEMFPSYIPEISTPPYSWPTPSPQYSGSEGSPATIGSSQDLYEFNKTDNKVPNFTMDDIDVPDNIGDPDFAISLIKNIEDTKYIYDDHKRQIINPTQTLEDACKAVGKMSLAEVLVVDKDGDGCLILSVFKNKTSLAIALVERLEREGCLKENINRKNNDGLSPLYGAVFNKNPFLVKYLIEHGANVSEIYTRKSMDRNNCYRFQLVHYASEMGGEYMETLEQLLLAGKNLVDSFNTHGFTPLLCAIESHDKLKEFSNVYSKIDSRPIIRLLCRYGANLTTVNNQSYKPPLQIAIEKKSAMLVELLLSLAAQIDESNLLHASPSSSKPANLEQQYNGGFQTSNWNYNDLNLYPENYYPIKNMNNGQPIIDCTKAYHNNICVLPESMDNFVNSQAYLNISTDNVFHDECMYQEYIRKKQQTYDDARLPAYVCTENKKGVLPVHNQQFFVSQDCASSPKMKSKPSLLKTMIGFRPKHRQEFSLLNMALDIYSTNKNDVNAKNVVILLLNYNASSNKINQYPEFVSYRKK